MLNVNVTCAQILAVLAAVTEVIKSKGGKESETEYLAALVRQSIKLYVYFFND